MATSLPTAISFTSVNEAFVTTVSTFVTVISVPEDVLVGPSATTIIGQGSAIPLDQFSEYTSVFLTTFVTTSIGYVISTSFGVPTLETASGSSTRTTVGNHTINTLTASHAASSSTPSSSSSSTLSRGAKAGIGVGVTLGVLIFIFTIAFMLFRKRRREANTSSGPNNTTLGKGYSQKRYEKPELDGTPSLPPTFNPALVELEGSSPPQTKTIKRKEVASLITSNPRDEEEVVHEKDAD